MKHPIVFLRLFFFGLSLFARLSQLQGACVLNNGVVSQAMNRSREKNGGGAPGRSPSCRRLFLLCALMATATPALRAQTPVPNSLTRIFLDTSVGAAPISLEMAGSAGTNFSASADIGRNHNTYILGYGRAIARGDLGGLFVSLVVGSFSRPEPGEYVQVTTAGEVQFGAAARVEATRPPPFPFFPALVPVKLMKSGFVEVSGHPDVVVIVNGVSSISRGIAIVELSVRGDDTSVLFTGGAVVNTTDTPDLTNHFGPENVQLDLRVGVVYGINLAASCTAVSPADGLDVVCKAEIDPIFEFDQDRFDVIMREQGREPFPLRDYFAIAYSPNLPGPPLNVAHVNGQLEISWPEGVLQSSTMPQTGWIDLTNTSPYVFDPGASGEAHRFFRTRHGAGP